MNTANHPLKRGIGRPITALLDKYNLKPKKYQILKVEEKERWHRQIEAVERRQAT